MSVKLDLPILYEEYPVKACIIALRRTARIPRRERLEAINKLLNGYGVESIRGEWQNGYWGDVVAAYVNMGDTYCTTIMQIRGDTRCCNSRFIVSSFGDWIERNCEKFGVK